MPDKQQFLDTVGDLCRNCGMCELGWEKAKRDNKELDPHVPGWYDHMSPLPRVMIIGQNPGWNEVKQGQPFGGAAGREFDATIMKHGERYGITRNKFYITNAVKCYIADDGIPMARQLHRCRPLLTMEINTIHPKFVVALGSVAFNVLCPGSKFSDCVGKIVTSDEFDIKVFTTYHPSPLNLSDRSRRVQFDRDIKVLCGLLFRIDSPF